MKSSRLRYTDNTARPSEVVSSEVVSSRQFLSGDSSQGIFTNRLNHFILNSFARIFGTHIFPFVFPRIISFGGLFISLDPSLLIQTYGICRYLQWQLTKYCKVAHWNAKKLLKIAKNKKSCYLNFKSCYQNFCIFFVNVNLKVYFLFVTIITNIGSEKLLEVSFKEMLEITG